MHACISIREEDHRFEVSLGTEWVNPDKYNVKAMKILYSFIIREWKCVHVCAWGWGSEDNLDGAAALLLPLYGSQDWTQVIRASAAFYPLSRLSSQSSYVFFNLTYQKTLLFHCVKKFKCVYFTVWWDLVHTDTFLVPLPCIAAAQQFWSQLGLPGSSVTQAWHVRRRLYLPSPQC